MALSTFIGIFVFLFGLIIGSFLNVCILRIPSGKSIVLPASACPKCGAAIRPWDNIPVISWLLLGGKCRSCKTKISAMYPIVELLTADRDLANARYTIVQSRADLLTSSAAVAYAVGAIEMPRRP